MHQDVNGQNTCLTPSRVEVLPIFFVPQSGMYPIQSQKDSLMHYLNWAQARYFEMLKFRSTFVIADSVPHIYTGLQNDAFYQSQTDGGASVYSDELLNYYGYTRFNCPYIFLIVYMSPLNLFPTGGGRPINAGFNTGGGIIILSSYDLDNTPNFESTLQHELGHSFGLPHVNVFGYDMSTNESIMSYNPNHHTNYFSPSFNSGLLIPENLRDLSLNKYVFPEMYFDSTLDIPLGYSIHPGIVYLGIFDIPNQTDYKVHVTTTSGETFGTQVTNIVQNQIKPSYLGMPLSFDQYTMWQSDTMMWADIEVHFPFIVSLDKIGVHSQHSGQYNEADSLKIEIYNNGTYQLVDLIDLTDVDQYVSFVPASDSVWRFSFRTGSSNSVTIRGLEFFFQDETIFPPSVPYSIQNPLINQLPSRPILTNPINNFLSASSLLNFDWTGNQATDFRLQIDTSKDFCSQIIDTVLSSNTYSFNLPLSYTTYYWRVKGLNNVGHGFGQWSEIRAFTSDYFTKMNEQYSPDLILYPNPTDGILHVVYLNSTTKNETLTIYDELMQEVYSELIQESTILIDLKNLRSGIYFLHFGRLDSTSKYYRIVKI